MTDSDTTVAQVAAESQPQVAKEATPEVKKHKVKVDGAEFDVDETELISSYQKGRSADKKFQEASELKKQVEQFVQNVQKNPEMLFEQLGLDPDNWAHQRLVSKLEKEAAEAALDPRDKKISDLESKLNKLMEAENKKREDEEKATFARDEEALVAKLDSEISEAFLSLGVSQPTPEMVAELAEQMLIEYKASKKQLSSKDALGRAKDSFSRKVAAWAKNSPEALTEFLSHDVLEKIAETYLKKKTPKDAPMLRSNTPTMSKAEDETKTKLNNFFSRRS